jgi:hypothetical protein
LRYCFDLVSASPSVAAEERKGRRKKRNVSQRDSLKIKTVFRLRREIERVFI